MVLFDPNESDWQDWDDNDDDEEKQRANLTTRGKVIKVDLLNELVLISGEDGERFERSVNEIDFSAPTDKKRSDDRNKGRGRKDPGKSSAPQKAPGGDTLEAKEWAEDVDLETLLED